MSYDINYMAKVILEKSTFLIFQSPLFRYGGIKGHPSAEPILVELFYQLEFTDKLLVFRQSVV